MLRTSGLCAAVLVREARRLDTAFKQKASYLIYQDEEVGAAGSAARSSARRRRSA